METNNSDDLLPESVLVRGELFMVERLDSGSILLFHPRWSLSGLGESLTEARYDLAYSAQGEVGALYAHSDPDDLDKEAQKMRKYLIDNFGHEPSQR